MSDRKPISVGSGLSHLNAWNAVGAVLRGGSIVAAAEILGVTRAAVAAQIRGLEDRLEQPLFARTPAGLVPLQILSDAAPRLLHALADLEAVQRGMAPNRSDAVSITTTRTFAETWIPHHLGRIYSDLGALDLRIEASWSVVDLATSEFDFAIRYMGEPETDIETIALFRSGVVPVATAEFAKRYGLSPETTDLSEVPIVHGEISTTDPDWVEWQEWSDKTGVKIRGEASKPSYELEGSGVRIALAGIGIVLGGMSEVLYAVKSGELVMPLGPQSAVFGSYYHRIAWPRARKLGRKQRQVRDWIVAQAQEDRRTMEGLYGAPD